MVVANLAYILASIETVASVDKVGYGRGLRIRIVCFVGVFSRTGG